MEIGCILFFPPLSHSPYRRVSVSLQSSWSVLAPFPAALTPSSSVVVFFFFHSLTNSDISVVLIWLGLLILK